MVDSLICEYCDGEYESEPSLYSHIRYMHEDELDWECPSCDKKFVGRKGMRRHHAMVHDESLRKSSCKGCGESFLKSDDSHEYCRDCWFDKINSDTKVVCEICGEVEYYKRWRVESQGRKTCGREECIRESISRTLDGHDVSEEVRKKISENIENPSGEDHHLYGKERSEEVRRKISETKKNQDLNIPGRNTRKLDTGDVVDSGWEEDFVREVIRNDIEYSNPRCNDNIFDLGFRTYTPDFIVMGKYVVEIKGYQYDPELCERTAISFMEKYPQYDYVVLGSELPSDVHYPWEDRELFYNLLKGCECEEGNDSMGQYNNPLEW